MYVGVFELSGAFNDLKYLSKVGDEHLWVKIWNNKGIHMQIILKLTKNCKITFFEKIRKNSSFQNTTLVFVLKFSECIKVYFKHISTN